MWFYEEKATLAMRRTHQYVYESYLYCRHGVCENSSITGGHSHDEPLNLALFTAALITGSPMVGL